MTTDEPRTGVKRAEKRTAPAKVSARPAARKGAALSRAYDGDDRIAFIMTRLFLVGCAFVLVSVVGDLLVMICKWIGLAIVFYVICGAVVRICFEKWPSWVTKPCARIRQWLDE